AGRPLAISTTNGTQALEAVSEAATVVVAGFCNLEAAAQYLERQPADAIVVCAGWKGAPCIEDTCFAGALAARLGRSFGPGNDSALLAEGIYRISARNRLGIFRKNDSAQRLFQLGLKRDVRDCLSIGTQFVLPIL